MSMSFHPTLRHVLTLIAKAIRFRAFLDLNKNARSLTNPVVRPKLEIKTTEGSVIFDFGLT